MTPGACLPIVRNVILFRRTGTVSAWAAYALAAVVVGAVYLAVPATGVRDVLYVALGYSAAAAIVAGVALHRPQARVPWYVFAAGICLVATGDALWFAGDRWLGGEGPSFSAADASYFAGYLTLTAAAVLLLRAQAGGRQARGSLIDALAVATAGLVLGWTLLVDPIAGHADSSVGERATTLAYLLLDLVLVAVVARLVLHSGRPVIAHWLIAAGFLALVAGDVLWRSALLLGSYDKGAWFDVLFPLAYVLWGMAALHPSMRALIGPDVRSAPTMTRVRLALLVLLTAAVPVALGFEGLELDALADLVLIAIASALLPLLVIVRLGLALGDVERMARAARAAEQRVRAVIEASPLPIALLDRNRRIAVWNGAAERATGWGEQEVLGRPEPFGPLDQAGARRIREALGRGEEARAEVRVPMRDGTLRDWDVSIAPVPDRDDEAGDIVAVGVDVTERNRAAIALRESEERFRSVFETALDAIVILDDERRCVDANPAACTLAGLSREEAVGRRLDDVLGTGSAAELWAELLARGELTGERDAVFPNGTRKTVEFTGKASFIPGRHLFVARDVSERKRQEERIRYVATHDALTELPNRPSFEDVLAQAVKRARRGPTIGLLLVDIDNFKLVNDSAGHPVGDRFLVALTGVLRASLRPGDFLARLGGDEFAATIEDVSEDQAKQIAARMVERANAFRFVEGGQVFDLGLSIGLCMIDGTLKPSEVMAVADSALHVAKEQGKNRAVLWGASKADRSELVLANKWVARIRQAIREDRLVLALQPVVDLETRRPVHHEALVRMQGAKGELVPPNAFLPAAARFGLMSEVDRWVIEHALLLLRADARLRLFVNLAGSSLSDDDLFQWIEHEVREAGLEPARLGFEITEKAAVHDMAEAAHRLTELRELGCQLALDDFGVDFASFEPLRRLPLDFVKVGDTFVRDLLHDSADRAIVQAIATVSHALGKKVIVEGIQSEAAAGLARSFGIEYGQGFLFGMPDSSRYLELTGQATPPPLAASAS